MKYKLVALDIDGVLTDGKLHYGPTGEEVKVFHVKDGAAIKELMKAGIEVCWITARGSKSVEKRAQELSVKRLHMRVVDKLEVLSSIVEEMKITFSEVCYAGDHLMDLPCMEKVGLAYAPNDAIARVKEIAHIAAKAKGGEGIVDEIADTLLRNQKQDARFHIIIPARYGSTRLEGKPLIKLGEKPMVQWVYEKAKATGCQRIVIATENEGIRRTCEAFGAEVIMTSPTLASGTDRAAAVAEALQFCDSDIVVNLQGDEPLMPKEAIEKVAQNLAKNRQADISTLCTTLESEDLNNSNVVKVVCDSTSHALYFSRSPIPFDRDNNEELQLSTARRHLGIYGYRVGSLKRLANSPQHPLERLEALEQLRALAGGMTIYVDQWHGLIPAGVDTEKDITRVAAALGKGTV